MQQQQQELKNNKTEEFLLVDQPLTKDVLQWTERPKGPKFGTAAPPVEAAAQPTVREQVAVNASPEELRWDVYNKQPQQQCSMQASSIGAATATSTEYDKSSVAVETQFDTDHFECTLRQMEQWSIHPMAYRHCCCCKCSECQQALLQQHFLK